MQQACTKSKQTLLSERNCDMLPYTQICTKCSQTTLINSVHTALHSIQSVNARQHAKQSLKSIGTHLHK